MDLQSDMGRNLVRIELEINGIVVEDKIIYKPQYDLEIKKMRRRGMHQRMPWAIFKTIPRSMNTIKHKTANTV